MSFGVRECRGYSRRRVTRMMRGDFGRRLRRSSASFALMITRFGAIGDPGALLACGKYQSDVTNWGLAALDPSHPTPATRTQPPGPCLRRQEEPAGGGEEALHFVREAGGGGAVDEAVVVGNRQR